MTTRSVKFKAYATDYNEDQTLYNLSVRIRFVIFFLIATLGVYALALGFTVELSFGVLLSISGVEKMSKWSRAGVFVLPIFLFVVSVYADCAFRLIDDLGAKTNPGKELRARIAGVTQRLMEIVLNGCRRLPQGARRRLRERKEALRNAGADERAVRAEIDCCVHFPMCNCCQHPTASAVALMVADIVCPVSFELGSIVLGLVLFLTTGGYEGFGNVTMNSFAVLALLQSYFLGGAIIALAVTFLYFMCRLSCVSRRSFFLYDAYWTQAKQVKTFWVMAKQVLARYRELNRLKQRQKQRQRRRRRIQERGRERERHLQSNAREKFRRRWTAGMLDDIEREREGEIDVFPSPSFDRPPFPSHQNGSDGLEERRRKLSENSDEDDDNVTAAEEKEMDRDIERGGRQSEHPETGAAGVLGETNFQTPPGPPVSSSSPSKPVASSSTPSRVRSRPPVHPPPVRRQEHEDSRAEGFGGGKRKGLGSPSGFASASGAASSHAHGSPLQQQMLSDSLPAASSSEPRLGKLGGNSPCRPPSVRNFSPRNAASSLPLSGSGGRPDGGASSFFSPMNSLLTTTPIPFSDNVAERSPAHLRERGGGGESRGSRAHAGGEGEVRNERIATSSESQVSSLAAFSGIFSDPSRSFPGPFFFSSAESSRSIAVRTPSKKKNKSSRIAKLETSKKKSTLRPPAARRPHAVHGSSPGGVSVVSPTGTSDRVFFRGSSRNFSWSRGCPRRSQNGVSDLNEESPVNHMEEGEWGDSGGEGGGEGRSPLQQQDQDEEEEREEAEAVAEERREQSRRDREMSLRAAYGQMRPMWAHVCPPAQRGGCLCRTGRCFSLCLCCCCNTVACLFGASASTPMDRLRQASHRERERIQEVGRNVRVRPSEEAVGEGVEEHRETAMESFAGDRGERQEAEFELFEDRPQRCPPGWFCQGLRYFCRGTLGCIQGFWNCLLLLFSPSFWLRFCTCLGCDAPVGIFAYLLAAACVCYAAVGVMVFGDEPLSFELVLIVLALEILALILLVRALKVLKPAAIGRGFAVTIVVFIFFSAFLITFATAPLNPLITAGLLIPSSGFPISRGTGESGRSLSLLSRSGFRMGSSGDLWKGGSLDPGSAFLGESFEWNGVSRGEGEGMGLGSVLGGMLGEDESVWEEDEEDEGEWSGEGDTSDSIPPKGKEFLGFGIGLGLGEEPGRTSGYPLCRMRYGGSASIRAHQPLEKDSRVPGLTLIDMVMLAALSYGEDKHQMNSSMHFYYRNGTEGRGEGNFPFEIGRVENSSAIGRAVEIHFPKQNLTVISFRGTSNKRDAFADLDFWSSIATLQSVDRYVIPLLSWIPTRYVQKALALTFLSNEDPFKEVVVRLRRFVDEVRARRSGVAVDSSPESDSEIAGDWEKGKGASERGSKELTLTSDRSSKGQRLRDWAPHRMVLVGHSLGGGLASLLGAQKKIPVVAVSPPGLYYVSTKYNVSDLRLESLLTSIVPEYDIVPNIDIVRGLVQQISCAARDSRKCHFVLISLCELVCRCGDPRESVHQLCAEVARNDSVTFDDEKYQLTSCVGKRRTRGGVSVSIPPLSAPSLPPEHSSPPPSQGGLAETLSDSRSTSMLRGSGRIRNSTALSTPSAVNSA
uniref:Uncharacterized protein n=1 Tax=Chromera velia CCMP2878 TaxID=1169474 RepID=A0A0G4I156_9ALVE|eukprot:Cvel_4.t1-p1 / transcript=Cvel_4.t1 / gene=Cvel_4 / organism=Chromera_velia_CCMP2878 / gene_product=hypothetical protein / transcript_product=hypothetical protein / location=Cvel_scaffold5:18950-29514(-) / protein_length=1617 / sequence_SO=supercontig / SO=protein_coding / is_pseudo=false